MNSIQDPLKKHKCSSQKKKKVKCKNVAAIQTGTKSLK